MGGLVLNELIVDWNALGWRGILPAHKQHHRQASLGRVRHLARPKKNLPFIIH